MTNFRNKLLVFLVLILIPFFKPNYFNIFQMSMVNSIYLYALRAVVLGVLIFYIYQRKYSKFILAMIIFYLVKGVPTILYGGDIRALITEAYPTIGIVMIIEIFLDRYPKEIVYAFGILLISITLINFISIIIDPHGYGEIGSKIYFQKSGNQITPIFIMTFVITSIITFHKKGTEKVMINWILLIMVTYMVFTIKSASGILAWIIIAIYFCIPHHFRIIKLFNIKTYIYSYIALYIGVFVIKIQNYLNSFFAKLGKNVTFTGRTVLWDFALEKIKERPLLGYGMSSSSDFIYHEVQKAYLSAHNQFIQLLYQGGLFALSCLLMIIYYASLKLIEYKETVTAGMLSIGILSTCLVLFSEAMGFFELFILLVFSYNIDKIVNDDETYLMKSIH